MNEIQARSERQALTPEKFFAFPWDDTPLGPVTGWSKPLRRSVEFLLECAQPMHILWGPERILLFNDAFRPLLGPGCQEFLGKPISSVWAGIWGEMGPIVEDAFRGSSRLIEDLPLRTRLSDYEELGYFTFAYSPIREGRSIVGVFCIVSDSTEKVLARHRLQQERDSLFELFERTPGFIAFSEGPDHRFTMANAAYRDFVGQSDLIGKSVAEVMPELEQQGIIGVLDQVYATGVPFILKGGELRLMVDGEMRRRFVNTIYSAVRDHRGTITGLFCEGHDVTDEKVAQERVADLQAELIHISRVSAMGTLASTLAHELNQPLTAISNYVRGSRRMLALFGEEAGPIASALDEADAHAVEAGEIIRRVRELVTRGRLEREKEIVADVIRSARKLALHNPALLGIDYEEWLDPAAETVIIDRIQIQQVMVNLLRNAAEAVAGVKDARIRVTSRIDEDGLCEIGVHDNGIGIQPEMIERLFAPFATDKAQGMGIGLSISRTIVEAHGGRIWVETEPETGAGACFRFTLELAGHSSSPSLRANSSISPTSRPTPSSPRNSESRRGRATIRETNRDGPA